MVGMKAAMKGQAHGNPIGVIGGRTYTVNRVWHIVFMEGSMMTTDQAVLRETLNVRNFGAVGDGQTKDTDAIAAAVAACAKAGGGTVYFPAGTYLTGPITMQSHMTLYVGAGATILGSPVYDDYPRRELRLEGTTKDLPLSLIFAENAENISIKGEGTIDGNGSAWWGKWSAWGGVIGMAHYKGVDNLTPGERAEFDEAQRLSAPGRPRLVEFIECKRILVDGVTLQNSPMWTLHPLFCEDVTINNVRLFNPPKSPNTDGINPDSCKYVRITNCHIDVGDDCITIKSGLDEEGRRTGRPCEQVAISNCTMVHGHGGVVIGSEMSGGVRDVSVSNCVMTRTNVGFRMKTKRGRGNVVENVSVSNLVLNQVKAPLHITMHYGCGGLMPPEPVSDRTPAFRDIVISNVHARDCEMAGQCYGLAERNIENVILSDVRITAKTGFELKDACGIQFNQVHIDTDEGPCLACENVEDLTILDSFRKSRPETGHPIMRFDQVREAYIRGGPHDPTCGTLIELHGDQTRDIRLSADGTDPNDGVFIDKSAAQAALVSQ